MQARALAVGLLTWGLLTGRLGKVMAMGMAGLAVLGMIEISGVQLGPGRATSFGEVVSRAIAPINLELAKEFSPNAKHAAGTVEWRQVWWEAIWTSVHSGPMLEAFVHGYGFPLISLAPKMAQKDNEDVRTPHNAFYYALGYIGWVGVVLFGALQLAILRLLWRSFRATGELAGLVFLVRLHGDGRIRGELRDTIPRDSFLPADRDDHGAPAAAASRESEHRFRTCTSSRGRWARASRPWLGPYLGGEPRRSGDPINPDTVELT
jgi:hypothetical protein